MRDGQTTNYYTLLELLPGATEAEMKKAWHEQLQVWHPDRFNHSPTLHRKAEARTQLINQAYQTLSDPAARARYDATTQPSTSHRPSPRPSPTASPSSESYASTTARTQQSPRSRQDSRGPRSVIMLSRQGQPKTMVPALTMLVHPQEHFPYDFHGFVRIAGVIESPFQREAMPLLKPRNSCASSVSAWKNSIRSTQIPQTIACPSFMNSNNSSPSPFVISSSRGRSSTAKPEGVSINITRLD